MENEYRFIEATAAEEVEFRVEKKGEKNVLNTYGIVFNKRSVAIYGMFYEYIKPEAINQNTDFSRAISKFNHDINLVIGTSWANTLRYTVDAKGVKYEVDLPNTETGNMVKVLAERGDLRGSSFEFRVEKEGAKWRIEKQEGIEIEIRDVVNIREILDLSPVMRPAYPDTEKSMKIYKRMVENEMHEELRMLKEYDNAKNFQKKSFLNLFEKK
jgi:HK97 family phage prohead protease